MKRFWIFISLLSFLSACEKPVVDVDLPQVEPELVLASFISSQDTQVVVYVSWSQPVFGTISSEPQFVQDATVILSGNGQSIVLDLEGDNEFYTASTSTFPIVQGQTYTLEVTAPNDKKATASCTVPVAANTSLTFDVDSSTNTNPDNFWDTRYIVNMRWQDIAGSENYYRPQTEVQAIRGFSSQDRDTSSYELYYERGDGRYVSDNNKDGQSFANLMGELYRVEGSSLEYFERPLSITFRLLTTDVHYYQYHKSVENFVGEDPFSEPTLIYSNVEGGLGVFCAYSTYETGFVF